MSVTHTLTRGFSAGGAVIVKSEDVSNEVGLALSAAIPANSTNLPMAFAFANAKLKSFFAQSDQDLSIFTNEASSGTPQDKIFMKANVPYIWSITGSFLGEVGDSAASPFDGDVTSLFVTNTAAAQLEIRAIVDAT